ncbi:DUF2691 family protein [Paenibacillus sp. GCM10023252]|uniref:DUF2691 family protein n=1 Tax=Paenibacillus sp. GCM10023252 TaxID=3252649 RepID=UPI00361A8171
MRGISFEIPNMYGRFLGDILKRFDMDKYNWRIGGEEAYRIANGTLGDALFPEPIDSMDGGTLKSIVENNDYYIIFQDLKAFPKGKDTIEIKTYEEYLVSDCELVLLVIDSVYVAIYCKDRRVTEYIYGISINMGYTKVKYITDENDFRTRLTVW